MKFKPEKNKNKCIIILSEKSSGSSACQNFLAKLTDIKIVSKTRHFENETLYWTKAASILGMPQTQMVDSEVPIQMTQAKMDLLDLLNDNLNHFSPPKILDKNFIFNGWDLLCERFSPIFLEKSPHHLCQWSAIELIVECSRQIMNIDFLVVGLIRNPMDTIYSQFKRWKARPEQLEKQWMRAYENLLKLKNIIGDRLCILRYEDMISSIHAMERIFEFCEISKKDADHTYFHQKSIQKWRQDRTFGFKLSNSTMALADKYGYHREELSNQASFAWPLVREFSRTAYKLETLLRMLRRKIIKQDIKYNH